MKIYNEDSNNIQKIIKSVYIISFYSFSVFFVYFVMYQSQINRYKNKFLTGFLFKNISKVFNFSSINDFITNKEKIIFEVNNETLENDINNLSIIDNKPIHLALVMAYIFSKNDDIKLESYQEKCKTIFGYYTENICAKHIYSVLGKSGISMLNNLGLEINSFKLEQNLLNADIEILYEILKNLNWKFKITLKK